MLACLENIVGISDTECDCILSGLSQPEKDSLKLSTTGLFVEDLPGGVQLKVLKNIDACRNLAAIMIGARDRAIQTLQDDLIVAISNRHSKAAKNYKGTIGRPSYAITLSNAVQFQGMQLTPRNHTDATVTLRRFQLIGNNAVTLSVYIVRTVEGYRGTGGEVVFTASVATSANNFITIPLPSEGLVLPLQEDGQVYEYWVYFDKALTAFLPKDCKIKCNCPGDSTSLLNDYFEVRGIAFADPAAMIASGTHDIYTHGIVLDVEIECSTAPLICREFVADEAIRRVMGQAANFKAGEYVIEEVMKSVEVNRFTMQAKEYNWGKRNHFRKEYDDRIGFIAGSIDVASSDCFVCKERNMFFDKIRS